MVPRRSIWLCTVLLAVAAHGHALALEPIPAAEKLLPNTTKGFAAAGSPSQLRESWNKTQLGQLMQDPAMKPFADDLWRQIEQRWSQTHRKLGLKWEDMEGVPSGEVSLALVMPSASEVASVVMADVTGHQQQVETLLAKVNENLTSQGGVRSLQNTVVVYKIPKQDEFPARQVAYYYGKDLLIASDSARVVEGILSRRDGLTTDSLANLPAFEAILNRCQAAAGELAPHARWFIEPFGYADAMRIASEQPRKKGTDMLKILKGEGFTAIQGVGGFLNFSVNQYEILHRTFVFAPGEQKGPRFAKAAQMLDLPNGGSFVPPDWVPRDIASYVAINVNVKNAFEASKTLVNQIVGDEVFEDVLESIRTDENGPKIDIRKELIAYLGNRVTLISDLQLPITPKSERLLVAVETTDPEKLADTIRRQMETDPDAKRREINGHVVWEVIDEEAELPMVTIENGPDFAEATPAADEEAEPEEKPLLPNSAVTVAFGQLFVATHIDILAKVLADEQVRGKLSTSLDYLQISGDLAKIAQPDQACQIFTRTDEAYRGTYELLREGKMPEAESIAGKLLNSLFGEGKEGVLRQQRLDGSKMPEYDMVRRYLGPAGATLTSEANGWLITGFVLNKQAE